MEPGSYGNRQLCNPVADLHRKHQADTSAKLSRRVGRGSQLNIIESSVPGETTGTVEVGPNV